MGDVGDTFRALNDARRDKRWANVDAAEHILKSKSIDFEVKNMGVHFIVRHNGYTVDFWPSTGKWIFRKADKKGRGIHNMLRGLEND